MRRCVAFARLDITATAAIVTATPAGGASGNAARLRLRFSRRWPIVRGKPVLEVCRIRVHPPARHTETVQIDHGAADFPYIQLAGILRGRINTGKYAPGARLPTITELIGETGLAPDTVRRAVGAAGGGGPGAHRPRPRHVRQIAVTP